MCQKQHIKTRYYLFLTRNCLDKCRHFQPTSQQKSRVVPVEPEAYCLITEKIKYTGDVLHDPEKNWGVYLHKRIPGNFTVPVEHSRKPIDKNYKIPNVNGDQMQLPGI